MSKRPTTPQGADPSADSPRKLELDGTPPGPNQVDAKPAKPAKVRRKLLPPATRPAHRPSKLTKERQDRIVSVLQRGMSQKTAIEFAGIGKTTFHEWMRVGEGKPLGHSLRTFHDAVKSAGAKFEVANVSRVEKAARNDPAYATWLLTHSPITKDKYALKQKVDHGGSIGFTLRDLADIDRTTDANENGPAPASTAVQH